MTSFMEFMIYLPSITRLALQFKHSLVQDVGFLTLTCKCKYLEWHQFDWWEICIFMTTADCLELRIFCMLTFNISYTNIAKTYIWEKISKWNCLFWFRYYYKTVCNYGRLQTYIEIMEWDFKMSKQLKNQKNWANTVFHDAIVWNMVWLMHGAVKFFETLKAFIYEKNLYCISWMQ